MSRSSWEIERQADKLLAAEPPSETHPFYGSGNFAMRLFRRNKREMPLPETLETKSIATIAFDEEATLREIETILATRLTGRNLLIIRMRLRGLNNADIGANLELSREWIRTILKSLRPIIDDLIEEVADNDWQRAYRDDCSRG